MLIVGICLALIGALLIWWGIPNNAVAVVVGIVVLVLAIILIARGADSDTASGSVKKSLDVASLLLYPGS